MNSLHTTPTSTFLAPFLFDSRFAITASRERARSVLPLLPPSPLRSCPLLVHAVRTHLLYSRSLPYTVPVVRCVERSDASASVEVYAASVFHAPNPAATRADEANVTPAGQWPMLGEEGCRTGPLDGNNYARSFQARALLELKHPAESRKEVEGRGGGGHRIVTGCYRVCVHKNFPLKEKL